MLKHWLKLIGWLLFGIFAAAVLVRTAAVCRSTNGGWEIVRNHLSAGLPPVIGDAKEMHECAELRQHRWLLTQVERVEADPNSTAADLLGAALLTKFDMWRSAPDLRELGRVAWGLEPHKVLYVRQDDWKEWGTRLRELVRKAIAKEPDNLQWRRLGAFALAWALRDDDVPDLEAAAKLDPDNALYDYLLGIHDFDRADVDSEQRDGNFIVRVLHPELLAEARRHYTVAMAKPLLATGQAKLPVVAEFLRKSNPPPELLAQCQAPFLMDVLRERLTEGINYPPSELSDRSVAPPQLLKIEGIGDYEADAAWFFKQPIPARWTSQWQAAGEQLFAPQIIQEAGKVADKQELAFLELAASQWRDKYWADRQAAAEAQIWSVAAILAAACGWLLLSVGTVGLVGASVAARFWAKPIESKWRGLTLPAALLKWVVLLPITLAYLGYLPAYRPKLSTFHWSVAVICVGLPVVLYLLLVTLGIRFVLRQGRLPSEQRGGKYQFVRWLLVIAIGAVFVFAMQCAIDAKFRFWISQLAKEFPGELLVSEAGGKYDNGRQSFDQRLELDYHRGGCWVIVQWGAHGGLYWAAGLWLLLALASSGRKQKTSRDDRIAAGGERAPPSGSETVNDTASDFRSRLIFCCRSVSRSAVFLGALMLLVCIALATQWVTILHASGQQILARLNDPTWIVNEIKAEAAAMEASTKAGAATGPTFSVPVDLPSK